MKTLRKVVRKSRKFRHKTYQHDFIQESLSIFYFSIPSSSNYVAHVKWSVLFNKKFIMKRKRKKRKNRFVSSTGKETKKRRITAKLSRLSASRRKNESAEVIIKKEKQNNAANETNWKIIRTVKEVKNWLKRISRKTKRPTSKAIF